MLNCEIEGQKLTTYTEFYHTIRDKKAEVRLSINYRMLPKKGLLLCKLFLS